MSAVAVRVFVFIWLGIYCACTGPVDLEEIVDSHMQNTALTYVDCGEVSYGVDQTACAGLTQSEQCIVDAFNSCSPAKIRVTKTTVEGDAIPAIVLVDTAIGGCFLTQFVDHSADAYKGGYGDIQQFSCAALMVPVEGCVVPAASECTLIDEWY